VLFELNIQKMFLNIFFLFYFFSYVSVIVFKCTVCTAVFVLGL